MRSPLQGRCIILDQFLICLAQFTVKWHSFKRSKSSHSRRDYHPRANIGSWDVAEYVNVNHLAQWARAYTPNTLRKFSFLWATAERNLLLLARLLIKRTVLFWDVSFPPMHDIRLSLLLGLEITASSTYTSKGHETHQDCRTGQGFWGLHSGASPSTRLISLNLDFHSVDAELSLPSMQVKSKRLGVLRCDSARPKADV